MKDRESLQLDGDDAKRENESYLVLETHGELYAVRWALVRQVGMLLQTDIDASQVPSQVQKDSLALPVYYLWELVGLKSPLEKPMEIPAVFLEEEDRRAVLVPERILWKQEATLQELPQWLGRAPIVMGAIVLKSGVVVIVLGPIGNNFVCEKAASQPGVVHNQ